MFVDPRRAFPLSPGVVLGIGLGGFVDGIVLHQILRWHHMVFLLHRAIRRGARWSGARLLGGMGIGWGSFNLVEGITDHHILGLHHVKENAANVLLWDLGFLAFGVLLVIAGAALARRDAGRAEAARDVRRVA